MKEKELLKYIVAFTMGDGFLSTVYGNKNKNSEFKATQRSDRKEFLELQERILSEFFKCTLYKESNRDCWVLRTNKDPILTKVRKRLYNYKGVRVLDPHYLKLIDAEFLALLYMADGGLRVTKRKTTEDYLEVTLYTNSYSYYDNLALADKIRELFDISFKVQKVEDNNCIYYNLICRKEEASKFLELTYNYKINCFNYKWVVENAKEEPKHQCNCGHAITPGVCDYPDCGAENY